MRKYAVTSPCQPKAFSVWLDAFRWIAASLVMIGHVGGPLLVGLSDLPRGSGMLMHYAYSFIGGFGHQGVMVFFVMSGLFVGGSLVAESQSGSVDPLKYLTKRFVRLTIVLWPALVLSFVLYTVGKNISPEVYDARLSDSVGISSFVCNALFMQGALCNMYAGNYSLWSLFHEFWYYMIFLIMVLTFLVRNRRIPFLLGIAAVLLLSLTLSVLQFRNAPIMPYMIIWLLGVYVAVAEKPRHLTSVYPVAIAIVLFAVAIRVLIGADNLRGLTLLSFATDIILSLMFTKLLINMKYAQRLIMPPLPRMHHQFAEFSFSLYCTHYPVAYFFSAVALYLFGVGFDMVPTHYGQWSIVFAALITCFAFGYLFSLATERHTNTVRVAVYAFLKSLRPLRARVSGEP